MMSDADGDTPPCSAIWSLKGAEAWDALKQQKYGGAQKTEPMVEVFKRFDAHVKQRESIQPVEERGPSRKLTFWRPAKRTFWQRMWGCIRTATEPHTPPA